MFQKQIEPYHVSLRRTQRHLAEYNWKDTLLLSVIYDEMESNLVQIKIKSKIMQMNTSAQPGPFMHSFLHIDPKERVWPML